VSNFNVGDTQKSVTFRVFDDSGLKVSGLVAATMPDIYWAPSGGDGTKITLSDLASIGAAWSSGGVFEKAGGAGVYRLCLPNAALASADEITIYGEASGKHVVCDPIVVGVVVTVGTNNDKTGYGLATAYDAAKTAAQAGDAMALTTAERAAIAAALLDLVDAIETGITPRQAIRAMVAALLGKLTTAGSNPEVYQNPAGTANRISVANDSSGNRTAVTLTL
jgi:hypothetical protein